jgi:outer membrane protein insertion porin family
VRVSVPIPLLAAALIAAAAGRADAAPARVALVPVTVHSADASSGYLSAGLASMLAARLEQFEEISVIRVEQEDVDGAGSEAALAAGREAGAEYVVFGSFTQFGDGASLDLECARVAGGEGGSRRIFVQSGTLGEIIPKLDELAEKIHLHVTGGRAATGAAAGASAGSAGAGDLERRVEALERMVFRSGPEQGPAAPPPPKAAASGGAGVR